MRVGDEQIGVPSILFRGTKAAIEALDPTAGQLAYAADDQLIGYSNGGGWTWIDLANIALQLHAVEHQNGGGDEINVTGLSGLLADPQNAGSLLGHVIDLTGLANGYTLVYNQGADKFVPAEGSSGSSGPHNTTHQDGGADEINVTGLSGLLADPQTPAAHTHNYAAPGHVHNHHDLIIDIEEDVHPQYARMDQNEWISGRWTFSPLSPGNPPFDITSLGTGKVGYLNADLLDGYHYNGIAPALCRNLTYYVATTGSDSNSGLSAGAPLRNIATAIEKFAGFNVKNCKISVAAGTYNEALEVHGIGGSMFDGLTIEGDTSPVAGLSFVHGDNLDTAVGDTYEGVGAITLATDNLGGSNRIRIIINRATTNPSLSGAGIGSANKVIVFDGAAFTEYDIYDVSGRVITLTATTTAPVLNVAGRFVTICPSVRIYGPGTTDTYSMEVHNTGIHLKGLYLNGYYGGLRAYAGGVMAERCTFYQRVNVNYYGAVHLTSMSFFYGRYDSLTDAHNTILGRWAGMCVSYSAHANSAKHLCASIGGYSLYCSAGTCYANGARLVGTSVGVYASARGYINAAATNAANWAPTKYSPATSDTFGNSNGCITIS